MSLRSRVTRDRPSYFILFDLLANVVGRANRTRVATPWTYRKIPMICSSLNRLLFIGFASFEGAELHFSTVLFQGVRPFTSPGIKTLNRC
jgi:hypothetical protein